MLGGGFLLKERGESRIKIVARTPKERKGGVHVLKSVGGKGVISRKRKKIAPPVLILWQERGGKSLELISGEDKKPRARFQLSLVGGGGKHAHGLHPA